jgi:hypothetical protein
MSGSLIQHQPTLIQYLSTHKTPIITIAYDLWLNVAIVPQKQKMQIIMVKACQAYDRFH